MIERNMIQHCRYLLEHFPAIAILGPRQVGKTMLAKQLGLTWAYFDLESPDNYQRISLDPVLFFKQYSDRVIIDEAQFIPSLFNTLRGVIDADRQKMGRFILTGSSSPELLKQVSESLAGRIAIVELGTLKANEFYQIPLSPLYELFENKITQQSIEILRKKTSQPLQNAQMVNHWLQGGYPEPVLAKDKRFYDQWMDAYRVSYVNRDIGLLFPRLNKVAYQRFLTTLSKLSGTIINKSHLARDIEVDERTVREYLMIAEGTFLWRMLYSYENNVTKSIVKMPKGYIRDSGLLNYLLRIRDLSDLYDYPQVGCLFEAFVIDEIVKGLNAQGITNYQTNYYRTRNGAEIDLILEGYFGVVPIEIKYSTNVQLRQLVSMQNFMKEHHLSLGIVINQGERFEWVTEDIIQIPVGWL